MQIQVPAPFPTGSPPWETLPPQVVMIIGLAVVVGAIVIFGPLFRAVARRIEGGGGHRELRAEVAAIKSRLDGAEQQALTSGEVDASIQNVYELEERLDFMERVLSRGGEEGES